MSGTQIPFMRSSGGRSAPCGSDLLRGCHTGVGQSSGFDQWCRLPRREQLQMAAGHSWSGCGLYVSRDAGELRPGTAGWYSMDPSFIRNDSRSFTAKELLPVSCKSGMPNFPGIFALKAGIDFLLSVGVDRLDRELQPVVKMLTRRIGGTRARPSNPARARVRLGYRVFPMRRRGPDGRATGRARCDRVGWRWAHPHLRSSLQRSRRYHPVSGCNRQVETERTTWQH